MSNEMNELIDAAEERAKLYDGDDRDCIKADVMNAFFAGAEYAQAAANKAAEEGERHPWFCTHCQTGVPSTNVTFEEEHDPRAGGCGCRVGDWPVAAEEGELPASDFQWRKKPVVIEAIQWPGCRFPETPPQWFIDAMHKKPGKPGFLMRMDDNIFIETLEGRMRAEPGDWIIRGIAGEIYPCKPEIFEASYERADRASRQVANKAEVEPTLWVQYIDGEKTQNVARDAKEKAMVESIHQAMAPSTKMEWQALYATPPANKLEAVPARYVDTWVGTKREGQGQLGVPMKDQIARWKKIEPATPPATTGASTVLTDERIKCSKCLDTGMLWTGPAGDPPEQCEYCPHLQEPDETIYDKLVGASYALRYIAGGGADPVKCAESALAVIAKMDSEVAAQAGQVAVLGKFANLKFVVDEYVKEDSKESDWSNEKLNRLQGEISQEAHPRLLQELLSMLASAPSPAKESK